MRNKRMFSLDIVDTDTFLDMPVTSQALYFHLGMRADDDGFVASPKKILRASGCNKDDLQVLISKGFLIPFSSGVVVVTHWMTNNYLRPDRYRESIYVSEKQMLTLNGGKYELLPDGIPDGKPDGIPNCNRCVTQKKEEKEEEVNNINIVEQSSTECPFDEIIQYLNTTTGKNFKSNSKDTQRHIRARISEGFTVEDFRRVIDLKAAEWGGSDMRKYLRPETLFGSKFEGYLNEAPVAPDSKPDESKEEQQEERIDLWSDD